MSQRGTFVAEYIRCTQRFEAVESLLLVQERQRKDFYALSLGAPVQIIAGKITAHIAGGEVDVMHYDLGERLSAVICHPLRMVVIPEQGNPTAFVFHPQRGGGHGERT